ncbi:uncharacterized protein [Diadema setosum]|uniref:uncharacterized protein n=1 Tax=Diadema setosum TaxID=31175 RepID=UPI003B3B6D24
MPYRLCVTQYYTTNHSTNTTMTTSRTFRQTDFLPTKFSGSRLDYNDCTAHILTFEDYLDVHDIDSDKAGNLTTILKIFKRTLEGQARLWIDKLTFTTYDDLKTAFTRRFSPAKSTFARVTDFNTMTMTDGESVETFLQRLRQTASYIDYGEKQIKDRLLAALTPDCRAAILMASQTSTTTPDEIAAKAQLFIDLRTDTTPTKEVTFATQDDVDLLSEEISSLRFKTEQKLDSRGRRRNRHSQHNDSDRSTSRSANVVETDDMIVETDILDGALLLVIVIGHKAEDATNGLDLDSLASVTIVTFLAIFGGIVGIG